MSVPDLHMLCSLYLDASLSSDERIHVMRMMFGGQLEPSDFHHVGLSKESLTGYLASAGYSDIARVDDLGLFDDTSRLFFRGRPISLNVIARKPRHDESSSAPAQPVA